MMLSNNLFATSRASARPGRVSTRVAAAGATPVAPAPNSSNSSASDRAREAHAAFTASLEKVVSAHRGTSVQHRELVVAQLALQNSSAARLQRSTHLGTLNMASFEEEGADAAQGSLPLSQLAFKAMLRASLAAARLHHGFLTTPHLLLGLISAGSASLATPPPPAAAAAAAAGGISASLAAAAEAAVVALIDGPGLGPSGTSGAGGAGGAEAASDRAFVAGAGAAASLLGRSCGLDVVQWVPQLSGPAKGVLLEAEQLRKEQGHKLLTTHHLLAVMLKPHSSSSSRSVVQQLLHELGCDVQQVSAAVAAAVAAAGGDNSSSSSNGAVDEDSVMCKPLGFLHEEFFGSLCGELLPASARSSSACLN